MRTMRAAVMHEPNTPLVVRDNIEVQDPQAGEVLVRIGASGVCRSDLHTINWDVPWPLPTILGHEGAGTIEMIGAGVDHVRVGDRVVLSWVAPCGACRMCAAGRPALCEYQGAFEQGLMPDGTSRYRLDGVPVHHFTGSTFAELSVVPAVCAIPIAADVPIEQLALVGCAVTTGVGAVFNTARVQPGETVVVIGCGGVGLSAIQGARLAGASRIIAVDTNAAKLALARTLGATDAVDASSVDPVEAVRGLTGGVDHAFEALGRPTTIEQAVRMTRRAGQATLIGMAPPRAEPSFPALDLVTEERVIAGSWYGGFLPSRDVPRIVGWLASGDLRLDAMIERIKLDDINAAFDRIRTGEATRQVIIFD